MPIIKEERLHKFPNQFAKVKDEVAEAVHYDWKRDKVDDAKKRAITTSANYDEFKNRVAGCTLKPIHKDEFNAPPKFSFNRQADEARKSSEPVGAEGALLARGDGPLPKNSREFDRDFRRRHSAAEKVDFLETLPEKSFVAVFGREVDAEMLGGILRALDEHEAADDGRPGVGRRFLQKLCGPRIVDAARRAVPFLAEGELETVGKLLARTPPQEAAEDECIREVFGLPAEIPDPAPSVPASGGMEPASAAVTPGPLQDVQGMD